MNKTRLTKVWLRKVRLSLQISNFWSSDDHPIIAHVTPRTRILSVGFDFVLGKWKILFCKFPCQIELMFPEWSPACAVTVKSDARSPLLSGLYSSGATNARVSKALFKSTLSSWLKAVLWSIFEVPKLWLETARNLYYIILWIWCFQDMGLNAGHFPRSQNLRPLLR